MRGSDPSPDRPRFPAKVWARGLTPSHAGFVCKACSRHWMKTSRLPRSRPGACPCCCRWRSTRPTTTCCPTASRPAPALSCWCRSGRRRASAWSGTAPVGEGGKPVADKKLKAITATLADVPPLPALSLRFAEWVARYTLAPLGMVVRMMMGSLRRVRAGASRASASSATRTRREPPRMTPARKRALEIAADGLVRAKGALAAEARLLDRRHRRPGRGRHAGRGGDPRAAPAACPTRPMRAGPSSPTRRRAPSHAMRAAADARAFSVTLLDGVTGSGKTEVYFEAVARTLEKGRQALIMLPEIALTSQFMDRFTRALRLPAGRVALGALLGRARAAPGARPPPGRRASSSAPARRCSCPSRTSASSSSTRSTTPASSRRTACTTRPATWRWCAAASASSPVVLASATPSIESHVNARTGRYRHVDLPGRYSGAELPEVVDHRPAPAPARAGQVALAGAGRGRRPRRSPTSSRRCCSSTAAAMRRSRCAAPAATASTARSARPGWSSTAIATGSTATTAASRCRSRRSAPSAASRTRSSPAARASSASPRRWPSAFRRRAWRLLSSDLVPSLTEMREIIKTASRPARPTSSSARRWWPRATTSRSSPPSASSTATWGSARPTRARPSAPSSSCTR